MELSPDLLTVLAALAWNGRSNYHAICDTYGLREDYPGMKGLKAVGFVRSYVSWPGRSRKGLRGVGKPRIEYELTKKGLARVIVNNVYFLSQALKKNEKSKELAINLITVPGTLLFFTTSVSFRKQLPKVARKMKVMLAAVGKDQTYAMLQELVSYSITVGKEGERKDFDWDNKVLDHLSGMLLYWAFQPLNFQPLSWLENTKLRSFLIGDPDFKERMRNLLPGEVVGLRNFAERLDALRSELYS
ncbi:MAG: RecX family transcriptional regulator [Thaumarchaeota archaeon]|nr:RecX family transcriptional regulator [Nitrososphaerota archaeon]